MTPRAFRGWFAALATLGAAGLAVAGAEAVRLQRPDVSTGALVKAATAYVTTYQKSFAYLIADETYTQRRVYAGGVIGGTRTMRGELFLTYLAADEEWIAVHDIAEVDGRPVPDRDDLRVLLSRGAEIRGITARIVARNARYNLGNVERNFNEPTLPLLLVEPKRVGNSRFDRRDVQTVAGVTLATLRFRERDRPTLVGTPRGPIRASGEITLEAGTGRIRRTTFRLEDETVKANLETVYAWDENVDLWVPSVFRERYEAGRGATHEVITCEARYTNYRRFTTSGRIK